MSDDFMEQRRKEREHGESTVHVLLTLPEVRQAADVGVCRWLTTMKFALVENIRAHNEAQRIGNTIIQACAEAATAKHLNLNWLGRWGNPKEAHFLGCLDVIWSRYERRHLIIQERHVEERWYSLVVGRPPNMFLCGVIHGTQAKTTKYVTIYTDSEGKAEGCTFAVPVEDLMPLNKWFADLNLKQ